ncbi:hypothetical protein [Cesiribacter sp. SM1]|uniref:hypothetical protein n=1 Tax=Cesiribacter sp. SM1 TaxID=2861196 RepID=UPI001CD49201|nr:hypothetical protein [Cesiribacter sp. SM1]
MANRAGGNNPAAEGFDREGSDSLAIVWADAVMKAQGGREAWDNTRYIGWNFFGNRKLLWDKHTGRVRIEVPKENNTYLINVNDEQGRVQVGGREITDEQERKEWIDKGRQIWVNDSYWLVMPYKLKDSGVTLTYAGKDTLAGGKEAEVLELRFKEVGYTPQNKYRVYIDPADSLVKAWAYYENAAMDTPNFMSPWQDYQQHGNILLSENRGERQITDINVSENVDETLFEEF